MNKHFHELIKIGIKIKLKDGKKSVSMPKKWQEFTETHYKDELNFAILTGKVNGIIVIDLDNKDPEFIGKKWFEDNFGSLELCNTLVTETMNKGYHIYFKYTERIKNKINYKGLNIDILVDKKCVYEGENYNVINDCDIREMTETEIALFEETKEIVKVKKNEIQVRDQDLNLNNLNRINKIFNMPEDAEWYHEKIGDTSYRCFSSCFKCLTDPTVTHPTIGHSSLFINMDKSLVTHCHSHKECKIIGDRATQILNVVFNNEDVNNKKTETVAVKLLEYMDAIYDGKNWYIFNDSNGIYEKKHEIAVIRQIEDLVTKLKNENFNYNWFEWTGNINYKKNLLEQLKTRCWFEGKIDYNDFLLGFPNGVLELKTKVFRKGDKDDYITMVCGVEYDTDTSTTLAEEVLGSAFINKEERQYIINRLAMSLDGKNLEQQISFGYGFSASNGKSFLMERMRTILGDYGGSFPVTLLTNKMKGGGEANSSLSDFLNKRFLYCSEPETGSKLNTNIVKQLTGDIIKTRNLYQEKDIEIQPSYKIFVCCNTLPNFDSYDEGISRRISIIEFKTKFCLAPKKKNERLLKRYTENEIMQINQGLLKILVDTYYDLYNNNYLYNEPDTFKSIRKLYLNDNKDIIRDILLENFEMGTKDDYIKMKDIKDLLKSRGIKEKDIITIIRMVSDTFEDIEFVENNRINYKHVRNIFRNLKYKDTE